MIVWTLPLMVKVWPAAMVHVCGAPTVTGALMVNELLAVMPPAVTVNEPPESEYPVPLIVSAWAMAVPLMVMARLVPVLSKMAPTSWLTQVKAVPLMAQLLAVLVSQVLLLLPVQVATASAPV